MKINLSFNIYHKFGNVLVVMIEKNLLTTIKREDNIFPHSLQDL